MRLTESLCPKCYRVVPAVVVEINGSMVMHKKCPIHGDFLSLVERDAFWWHLCDKLNCRNIYNGYLIDITDRCNIKCKYCYHKNGGENRPVKDIITEAEANKNLAPFILVGGEPTVHKDFPEILRKLTDIGETNLITNGVKLSDEKYLDLLCKNGLLFGNALAMGLSFHKEANGKDIEFVELCRKKKYIIGTTLYVIDEISQIDEAVKLFRKYQDVIPNMRIKAASNLGIENNADNKIFVSDMINYLKHRGKTDLVTSKFNKVSYGNVIHEGLFLMLVSWYDTQNIDLLDINCPPYYKAMDGGIYNFVTSALINEGILNGKRGRT